MQSCGATKAGGAASLLAFLAFEVFLAFADFLAFDDLAVAWRLAVRPLVVADADDEAVFRASAALPRFEFHTASALVRPALPVMNGFGARPLPSAISSIARPDATEVSSSRMVLALPSLAYSSRCLIRSQLVRKANTILDEDTSVAS